MKKFIIVILIVVFLMISLGCTTIASNEPENNGPAPGSGDGIDDGSEFDDEEGSPNDSPFGEDGVATGPAPNAGDGIHDGSGF